jgi:hypothetical protein
MPGLARAGIDSDGPRPKAKKSFTWINPATSAIAAINHCDMRDSPISRNRLSHAAMNAK